MRIPIGKMALLILAAILVASRSLGCAGVDVRSVRQLGQKGDTTGLLECWQEADGEQVRLAIIEELANFPQDQDSQQLLIRELRSGTVEAFRLAAIRALETRKGPDVIEALIWALGDPNPTVRQAARTALSNQGESAHSMLLPAAKSNSNHLVRAAAIRLLIQAADTRADFRPQVTELLVNAARSDDSPKVREVAVGGLVKLSVSSARPLVDQIKRTDDDAGVRMAADRALLKLGGPAGQKGVVVAVLPLKNDTGESDAEITRLGTQIAEYVTARLGASRLCQVVDRAQVDAALTEMKKLGVMLYDGETPNAPELGRFQMANQLIYGTIQRQGLQYTILVNRMDVSSLKIIPGASATATGYRADLEQMKIKVTDRLIANFHELSAAPE